MSAIDDVRQAHKEDCNARPIDLMESILELSDSIEKETINRRRDTLNILSTIAGVEDRFADFINVLEERIDKLEADHNKPSFQTDLEALTERVKELEDRLANHVNVKEVSDDR